ncbi:hypothetical protein PRBRB14_18590 [Hallella multisaccharivorax DSM 17128]|nr:hypothetical protein PRBRB14_18590 [Hallella multisaccharivorax DSM 17128]
MSTQLKDKEQEMNKQKEQGKRRMKSQARKKDTRAYECPSTLMKEQREEWLRRIYHKIG